MARNIRKYLSQLYFKGIVIMIITDMTEERIELFVSRGGIGQDGRS